MRICRDFFLAAVIVALSSAHTRTHADLQTDQRIDKVVLKDGTEIECMVLMVTRRGALIVEQDPKDKDQTRERIIPNDQIERIDRGESDGTTAGFQTAKDLAHKVIRGSGFRKTEKKKDKKDEEAEKKPVGNPTLVMGKAKTISTHPTGTASTGKLTAQDISNSYLSRFPVLKSTAQTLIGSDRLPQLIELAQKGDPLARKQVEGFLKLFLGGDNSALNEKPQVAAPQKTQKPARPERTERPGRAADKNAKPPTPPTAHVPPAAKK